MWVRKHLTVLDILADILLASAYAALAISASPDAVLYSSEAALSQRLIISAWTSGLILNVFVTGAIAGRLWWMARTMASLTVIPTNRFASSIYIVVESGAIPVVTGAIVLAFCVSNDLATFSVVDVASQLTVRVHLSFLCFRTRDPRLHFGRD